MKKYTFGLCYPNALQDREVTIEATDRKTASRLLKESIGDDLNNIESIELLDEEE